MQQLFQMPKLGTYQLVTSQAEIHNEAFHLTNCDDNPYKDDDPESPTGSVLSKQRIDMMFQPAAARSVVSDYQPQRYPNEERKTRSLTDNSDFYDEYEIVHGAKNDVQLRIEKMFSEVSSSEQEAELSLTTDGQFLVKYMGSVPVASKINSLDGLQIPLSELYFKYRKNKPDECLKDNIEVTLNGLQIEYANGKSNKPIFKMYPFSCIAVWVSVKVFCRKRIANRHWEYAFLPLVADSEGVNNASLFHRLQDDQLEYFQNRNYDDNSPLFVVVLRETDFQTKQLVCQGFVCKSSDEAIALADMLYKVLNSKLKRSQILRTRNQRRRLRYKNGMSRLSSIGETVTDSIGETITESLENEKENFLDGRDDLSDDDDNDIKVEQVSTSSRPPKRPPRKQKDKSAKAIIANSTDNLEEPLLQSEEINSRSNRKKKLHRTSSIRSTNMSEIGDVLTKIAIPRSRSFLNKDKLSSRYRNQPNEQESEICSFESRRNEDSPLGFMELFNELQIQEGLSSLDEILNVIVNTDGMSFNNLKPIYKEFLLKLALVLTKDELFERSKLIMKRQKQKQKQSKRRRLGRFARTKRRLKNIFQPSKITSKLKSPFNKTDGKKSSRRKRNKYKNCNNPGDSTSTDSFFMTKSTPHRASNYAPEKSKQRKYRKNSMFDDNDRCKCDRRFHSKEKDSSVDGLKGSSSGYFSFSECSYDTESCVCATIDRCYCSLVKNKKPVRNRRTQNYDIDTCYKNNKCYCDKISNLSLVEQLKMKGFAASESSLSGENTLVGFELRSNVGSKPSKSLRYVENDNFRYAKRMDVYSNSCKENVYEEHSCKQRSKSHNHRSHCEYSSTSLSASSSKNSANASITSDNLATVDYNLFARSNKFCESTRFVTRNCPSKVVYAELAHPSLSPEFHNRKFKYTSMVKHSKMKPICEQNICDSMVDDEKCCNCKCSNNMLPHYLKKNNQFRNSNYYYKRTNMENYLGYYP